MSTGIQFSGVGSKKLKSLCAFSRGGSSGLTRPLVHLNGLKVSYSSLFHSFGVYVWAGAAAERDAVSWGGGGVSPGENPNHVGRGWGRCIHWCVCKARAAVRGEGLRIRAAQGGSGRE